MAAEVDDPVLDTRTLDAVFEELGRQDLRFGGFVIENGIPTLLLTDSTNSTAIVNAVRGAFARHTAGRELPTRVVQHSFGTLAAWRRALYANPLAPTVTAVDLDEHHNRLRIAPRAGLRR